jgi:hypothetical protein
MHGTERFKEIFDLNFVMLFYGWVMLSHLHTSKSLDVVIHLTLLIVWFGSYAVSLMVRLYRIRNGRKFVNVCTYLPAALGLLVTVNVYIFFSYGQVSIETFRWLGGLTPAFMFGAIAMRPLKERRM